MHDLNMLNAMNAELRSVASPSSLACDASSSAFDKRLAEQFRLAMEGEENGSAGARGGAPSGGERKELKENSQNAEASALFSSLFSLASMPGAAPVEEVAPLASPLSPIELEALVDRILVSEAVNGGQEVRLILSDSVLRGTEISLHRTLEGQLVVSLSCTNEAIFQTLVASRLDLKTRLEDFENRSVQVSVDIDQESNDANRRSRGYHEQEQQEA